MNESFCDPVTGVCRISTLSELTFLGRTGGQEKTELIYVGDPMCSWCWGISPSLFKLREEYRKYNIPFRVVVGGLRPGGGDKWDEYYRDMLRHHWEEVNKRSGQPFGFGLFELENFDYDTEPSCRAVVAARKIKPENSLEFFEGIHRKFYVDSQDPKQPEFYKSICAENSISYDEFLKTFESDATMDETFEEFDLNRKWGVEGFPSVLLSHNNKLHYIANGFSSYERMNANIDRILGTVKQP